MCGGEGGLYVWSVLGHPVETVWIVFEEMIETMEMGVVGMVAAPTLVVIVLRL